MVNGAVTAVKLSPGSGSCAAKLTITPTEGGLKVSQAGVSSVGYGIDTTYNVPLAQGSSVTVGASGAAFPTGKDATANSCLSLVPIPIYLFHRVHGDDLRDLSQTKHLLQICQHFSSSCVKTESFVPLRLRFPLLCRSCSLASLRRS